MKQMIGNSFRMSNGANKDLVKTVERFISRIKCINMICEIIQIQCKEKHKFGW